MTVLYHGDCVDLLRTLPDNSIDACVTDPPYGLSFMGKRWDYDVPSVDVWAEVLRVLKPGAHLLCFAGTRTQHRMAVRIEDAGFEIRDMLAWVYGSGFPKSLGVSKAIDKIKDWTKVERLNQEIRRAREESSLSLKEVGDAMQAATGGQYGTWYHRGGHMFFETGRSLPSRPEWEHLIRVLPIAPEFIGVYDAAEREVIGPSRRDNGGRAVSIIQGGTDYAPTAPATDAARQWHGWGTALKPAMECITLARKPLVGTVAENVQQFGTGAINVDGCRIGAGEIVPGGGNGQAHNGGRFGAHETNGTRPRVESHTAGRWPANLLHDGSEDVVGLFGSAARFFYCAKASPSERGDDNTHPTVKPVALMRYLVRLITPPGGTVLDPFMGSGSTGNACAREGVTFIGSDREADYVALAQQRIDAEHPVLPFDAEE